jgi:hypothetical protein
VPAPVPAPVLVPELPAAGAVAPPVTVTPEMQVRDPRPVTSSRDGLLVM